LLVNRRCGLIAEVFCKLFVNRSTNYWSIIWSVFDENYLDFLNRVINGK
jgi:hypothetical protein